MDKLIPLGLWGIGNDHMKIGGVKYFTDGSIQGFTGALLEDYYTRPGYKGALLWSQEEIDEIIIKYHCLGFQGRRAYQRRRRLGIGHPSF